MKTYKLYLIRTGLTKANEQGLYCGSTDIPLSELGRAELVKAIESYRYPYVERVYCSPLLRATETADILYPGVETETNQNLIETSFGIYEGKSLEQLKDDDEFQKFISPNSSIIPEGAENPREFYFRCLLGAREIVLDMMKQKIGSAAVVTHASVIANILSGIAYPKKPQYDWNPPPGHGFCVMADQTLFLREPVLEVISEVPFSEHSKDYLYDDFGKDPYPEDYNWDTEEEETY